MDTITIFRRVAVAVGHRSALLLESKDLVRQKFSHSKVILSRTFNVSNSAHRLVNICTRVNESYKIVTQRIPWKKQTHLNLSLLQISREAQKRGWAEACMRNALSLAWFISFGDHSLKNLLCDSIIIDRAFARRSNFALKILTAPHSVNVKDEYDRPGDSPTSAKVKPIICWGEVR